MGREERPGAHTQDLGPYLPQALVGAIFSAQVCGARILTHTPGCEGAGLGSRGARGAEDSGESMV